MLKYEQIYTHFFNHSIMISEVIEMAMNMLDPNNETGPGQTQESNEIGKICVLWTIAVNLLIACQKLQH